jgi:transposase
LKALVRIFRRVNKPVILLRRFRHSTRPPKLPLAKAVHEFDRKRSVKDALYRPLTGHQATHWTVPLLAQHLRQHHDVDLRERTLRLWLHEFGYRWKRPRYVLSHRAPHLPQKKGRSFDA